MLMDPKFIEKAQRRRALIFKDCREYMKIHNWANWVNHCHYAPCEAVAYGHGVEGCELRAGELRFLDVLLKGSNKTRKPGPRYYHTWGRGKHAPKARIVKP